jgi:hypothetical protein
MKGDNKLGDLYRNRETTDRYHEFKKQCAENNVSVVQYIIKNRLMWTTDGNINIAPTSTRLFASEDDLCFIPNDFPYNFEPCVTHLVLWSKRVIPNDPESSIGDVSDGVRRVIYEYVHRNFVQHLGEDNVLWFRNFPILQSVVELSHVHILVKNIPKDFYQSLVNTPGVVLNESEVDALMDS